jgi:hypothetical protein
MQIMTAWDQKPPEANRETSGRSRAPSLGFPKTFCQEGFEKTKLGAPAPATMSRKLPPTELLQNSTGFVDPTTKFSSGLAHDSFQGVSGI